MKKYKLAIVGATGLVGRTVLQVLKEKKLPIYEYVLFSSKKSAGQKIVFMDKEYIVHELTNNSFTNSDFDFAIFSAGGETARKYAPIAAKSGCIVIDNSSAFRMDENVPLIVPEVNAEEIYKHKGIISNPNCSTIQAVVALKPLDDLYKIKRIVYSTYQAVSGAGKSGVIDLENGVRHYLTDLSYSDSTTLAEGGNNLFKTSNAQYPLYKFPYPIFSNCIPHIDAFLENGYTKEEEKMINETRKILKKPNLKITATAVRVPVLNCHGESINIEFENDFELSKLIELLRSSPGIIVEDDFKENIYPLAHNVSGTNDVFVGRIRRDYSVPYGINLWVVADNIRKGAATNAVQILEKLCKN